MKAASVSRICGLVVVLALAFALRVYDLDGVPLRGDEAFAVRYWASAPLDILESDWAPQEPHPFGTFLAFWGWKNAASDAEFTMRYLPLLGNMIGVAAMAAITRRMFGNDRAVLLAALLWAVNPFQIWHAQDVRNYAIWAGLSPLAMWLFLRAAASGKSRDWGLYVVAETLAMYSFFLESFFIVVQAIYLLVWHRTRRDLRRAFAAWAVLGVLLVPWFGQLWWLSDSGYAGAVREANLGELITWFVPVLLIGDEPAAPWQWLLPLLWTGMLAVLLVWRARRGEVTQRVWWLVAWIAVPVGLLLVAATNMSVFHPRYLIPVTPALILLMVAAVVPRTGEQRAWGVYVLRTGVLLVPLLGIGTLVQYYRHVNAKSPDWPALATYLETRTTARDRIVQVSADPAFNYYFRGAASEMSLFPNVPVSAQLRADLNFYEAFWLVGRWPEAELFLDEQLQRVSMQSLSSFTVFQYRPRAVADSEIAREVAVDFGAGHVHLRGVTIQGPDSATSAITVFLYWDLAAEAGDLDTVKASVQLLGPPHPPGGTPLWDQGQDHAPQSGRDVFNLRVEPSAPLVPGTYTLEVVVYPADDPSQPLPVTVSDGTELGQAFVLATFDWPLSK